MIQTSQTLDESLDRYYFIYTTERRRPRQPIPVAFPRLHSQKEAKQGYIDPGDDESRSCAGDQ